MIAITFVPFFTFKKVSLLSSRMPFFNFMSYHKVILDKLFPYAPYLNIRVGIEILVEKGQDPMEAFEDGWQKIHDFRNKHIQEELAHQYEPTTEIQVEKVSPEQSRIQALVKDIGTCQDIIVLESYRLLVRNKPELQTAFDNKLKQLSNGLQ